MRLLRLGLLVGLFVAAAACGSDDTTSTGTTSTDPPAANGPSTTSLPTDTATSSEPTAPPPATADPGTESTTSLSSDTTAVTPLTDVKVYFLRDERLAIAHREVRGPATLRGALTGLLAGPTGEEYDAGLLSEIPPRTSLLDLNLSGGVATVDLSSAYAEGGGSLSMSARVAQVVFTATQFDNVERVQFWLDGKPIDFLGGEGIVVSDPLERLDVDRSLSGGVIIDTPAPGSTVTSPFTVTGEGDVFEGDFPIVVRRNGVQIAGPFLSFAGAWGDWADFETTITVDEGPGPIEVVAWDEAGCTPGDAECSPVTELVVPLQLDG